jgi:hypothetical protein
MPRTLLMSPVLQSVIDGQDGVVSLAQLEQHGFTASAVQHRVGRGIWMRPLPEIILTATGPPTRRQRLIAARLWAGVDSVVDADDACAWYGLPPQWFRPELVHLVVPDSSSTRQRGFVVVRRSASKIVVGDRGLVPYVNPATAVIACARRAPTAAATLAYLSLALQRGLVTVDDLASARGSFGDKWCRRVDAALVAVGVGVRSPAEKDALKLFRTSRLLPPPQWNVWISLGDGGPPVCVDALWEDAGLVAEINGRTYHAWADQYEKLHRRGARITSSGLTVMHCTPRQLRQHGPETLRQLERTYIRLAGMGLPRGVTLISRPPIAV